MFDANIRKTWERVKKRLETIRWGDCMCWHCQQRRVAVHMPELQKELYPKFNFKPPIYETYTDYEYLEIVYKIRLRNAQIRRNHEAGTRLYFCRRCGNLHPKGYVHKGKRYCEACAQQCSPCGFCEELHTNHMLFTVNDSNGKNYSICHKCYRTEFAICGGCGSHYRLAHLISYARYRDERGEIDKVYYCPTCYSRGKVTCDVCGDESHDTIVHHYDEMTHCPACHEDRVNMHEYYYKPLRMKWLRHPTEGKVKDTDFHMGFELEVAATNSMWSGEVAAMRVKRAIGIDKIYSMHDGTIERATKYTGVETVTHPFTWQWYKKGGATVWDDLLKFYRDNGWKANLPGIGLHIHTTKAAWGSVQIWKLFQFCHKHIDFVIDMAGRAPTKHCIVSAKDFDESVLVAKDKKNRRPDHYSFINLNNGQGTPSKTIEFRLFQGTLEPLYLHKNIEFVKALYEYTRAYKAMDLTQFVDYVQANRREYPCLNEFLKLKGYI